MWEEPATHAPHTAGKRRHTVAAASSTRTQRRASASRLSLTPLRPLTHTSLKSHPLPMLSRRPRVRHSTATPPHPDDRPCTTTAATAPRATTALHVPPRSSTFVHPSTLPPPASSTRASPRKCPLARARRVRALCCPPHSAAGPHHSAGCQPPGPAAASREKKLHESVYAAAQAKGVCAKFEAPQAFLRPPCPLAECSGCCPRIDGAFWASPCLARICTCEPKPLDTHTATRAHAVDCALPPVATRHHLSLRPLSSLAACLPAAALLLPLPAAAPCPAPP